MRVQLTLAGNVDVQRWYSGDGMRFIEDADKVMGAFYHFCHLAGPEGCAFYDSSPTKIETRLDNLLTDMKTNPVVTLSKDAADRPTIISYSDIRRAINSALYRPIQVFPELAKALSGLESGDGTAFLEMKGKTPDPFRCDRPAEESHDSEDDLREGSEDATAGVMCSEAKPVPQEVEQFAKYADVLVRLSKSAGATAANMRMVCVGWEIPAKWDFDGMS